MTNDKSRESESPQKESPNGTSAPNGRDEDAPRGTPLGDNTGVHIPSSAPDASASSGIDIDFGGFIISLGTSCMVNLGKFENPETGAVHKDLDAAKQVIHILNMLRDKTRGNLEPEEERLLSSLIHDLKVAFVQASR
ncbi:MAG: DUF1844 domain-containing protein [Bradymonadaceae bacterium]